MRILYITKFFPPEYGGIETLSKNICDFFHNKRKKIEVISFSKKKTYVSKKNIYKVNFFKPIFSLFSTPISLSIIIFLYIGMILYFFLNYIKILKKYLIDFLETFIFLLRISLDALVIGVI